MAAADARPNSSAPAQAVAPAETFPSEAQLVTAVTSSPLSDRDILEIVTDVYEAGAWAADMGMVDFAPFARLVDVLRELRLRVEP